MLKKIPGINCAYCGRLTLPISIIDKDLCKSDSLEKVRTIIYKYKSYINEIDFKSLPQNIDLLKKYVKKIFEPISSTVDHIVPESAKGQFKLPNLLLSCRKCNSDRGNMPLKYFLEEDDKRSKNIEEQLKKIKNIIPKFIIQQKLSNDYICYTECVSRTIYEQTGGRLSINL